MNKIEKQILTNQVSIMSMLAKIYTGQSNFNKDDILISSLDKKYHDTLELLEPQTQDEECSDGLPVLNLSELDEKKFVNSGEVENKDKMEEKFI